MTKTTIGGISSIIVVIILLITLGTLPNEDASDAKSAVKNAGESLASDALLDSSGQAISIVGEQAIQSSCENPNSNSCKQTKSSISMVSIAFVIVIVAVIIDGLIGFSKWIIRSVEFVLDLIN